MHASSSFSSSAMSVYSWALFWIVHLKTGDVVSWACRPDPNESPYGRPDPALQSATNLIQSSDQDYEAIMK